ncbi:MAG: hypothetical protein JXA33_00575 [Anaerolineae bacterium]|nr:hypothetical protein [Anaerolineae bacterium]
MKKLEIPCYLQRVFCYFNQDRLVLVIFFVVVFVSSLTPDIQSDTWWNLASGRLTWTSRRVWLTDPFSFTAPGAFWPNHEWLSQVFFYGIYQLFGFAGLDVFFAIITTITWGVMYKLSVGIPRYRVIFLLVGVISHITIWSYRPHIFTILAIALLLLLLQERERHKWIPPLFLIWANLHGGVGIGGGVLVLTAIVHCFYRWDDWKHWATLALLSGLATLITPLGPRLWWFSLSMLNHPQTTYIEEWLPPSLRWPISYPFFIIVFMWLFVVIRRRRFLLYRADYIPEQAQSVALLIVGFVFMALGFKAMRHTVLFTLVALPLITRLSIAHIPLKDTSISPRRGLLYIIIAGVISILCVFLVIYQRANNPTRWRPFNASLIAALRECPGNLYNTYETGGILLWFVPERAIFVDSRNDPYPLDLLYAAMETEQSGEYQSLFQQHQITCALVQTQYPFYGAIQNDKDWVEVYNDVTFAVFHKLE